MRTVTDKMVTVPRELAAFLRELRDAVVGRTLVPDAITSDTNDYDPPGLSGATTIILTNGGDDLTGLAGGSEGRTVALIVPAGSDIYVRHQSILSSADNRFALDGAADVHLIGPASLLLRWTEEVGAWSQI